MLDYAIYRMPVLIPTLLAVSLAVFPVLLRAPGDLARRLPATAELAGVAILLARLAGVHSGRQQRGRSRGEPGPLDHVLTESLPPQSAAGRRDAEEQAKHDAFAFEIPLLNQMTKAQRRLRLGRERCRPRG